MTCDSTVRLFFGPCKLKFQEFICIYRNSITTINPEYELINQLNLLVDKVNNIQAAPVTNRSDQESESFVKPSLAQTGFTFCKENCCSSLEFPRLQTCEKCLENMEF